jgi:aspartate aminotransferase
MNIPLARRLAQVKPSVTLKLSARAKELTASGKPIINLTVGEPDMDTWESIKEAARVALGKGLTKYTAVEGTLALRQAIVEKFKRDNQLTYDLDQVIVSNGGKQSIYNAMQALLNPGDDVLLIAPFWTSYWDMALLANANPIVIHTRMDQNFKVNAQQLSQAITPKTRLLILNSPSNPTGMVYGREELAQLAEVLMQHRGVVILSDDIYEHIYWDTSPFVNIVQVCPELYARTVIVNGVSKAYAMTGWRIGYAAGPKELIEAMGTIQSQSTSGANSIAQFAAHAALTGDQAPLKNMQEIFKRRHDFFYTGINQIPRLQCLPAQGAFYCFVCVKRLLNQRIKTDVAVSEFLLEKAQVASVPGSAFGQAGYLRFSFAIEDKLLADALQAIAHALDLHYSDEF